jgi:hypothetical protein
LDGLVKKSQAKDYVTKVPEDVRKENAEKMELLKAEIETLQRNIESFKKMAA